MSTCNCEDTDKYLSYTDITSTECINEEHVIQTIVFEPTMVGKTAKKSIHFKTVTKPVTYVLKRDPDSNPIYQVFDIKVPNGVIEPGKNLTCTVTYSPNIIDQKNVDYFELIDSNFQVIKVCVQGNSIGPSVEISLKNIILYNTKTGKKLTSTFEIRNNYNAETHFSFDANKDQKNQDFFKIDKVSGSLPPRGYIYVTVRFSGTKNGFYSNHLFCRVENHSPLMIRVFAIISPTIELDPECVGLLKISEKYPTTGFNGYMYDSIRKTSIKPPFSLSTNWLDFGSVEYEENCTKSKTLVTSLTNHMSEEITVVWMIDNDQIFSIFPKKVTIPALESVLYECSFTPNCSDNLFTKLVTGQVFWSKFDQIFEETEYLEEILIPLNINIILSGRSFPLDKLWLPLVEIKPNVIILPPTIPRSPSYTTTLLKSTSLLPTAFKFISPRNTNFILKPMLGIIYDFQVIVVQLQSDGNNQKAYVERWGLQLNGRSEDCVPIFLKGFAENITVCIGDNYAVTFSPVQPGCQDIKNVVVSNKTIHCIKYNFNENKQDYIEIDYPEKELASNEFVNLRWFLRGSLSTPECFTIKCHLQNLNKSKMLTGDSSDLSVIIHNKCVYSELCATPSFHNFGDIEYDSTSTISFYLFNFGESPLHFLLSIRESNPITNDVRLVPNTGTLGPKQKVEILMSIKGTVVGEQKIEIIYKLRLNISSAVIVQQHEEPIVFSAHLDCKYATVQICDIPDTNFGFLFSKISLWNMLKLTELNDTLATIKHNETKAVEMFLPEYEIGEATFYARLTLKNLTNFPTKVKFKFKKNCHCPKVEKSVGISFRQYVVDCVHTRTFHMLMEHEDVKPNGINVLQLDVNYIAHGLITTYYTISLAYNRTINLKIHVYVLPEIVTMPSKYFNTYDFKLSSVYIGEQEPPAQAFPIYNNSASTVSYDVDLAALSDVNFQYDFEVFNCLNPCETLSAFTSSNIIFTFHPISIETYKVLVPIKMGDKEITINITGDGCNKPTDYHKYMVEAIPSITKNPYLDVAITLSTDYLVIKPFQVWSGRETMIFIRNQSNNLIGYSWQNASDQGTVFIESVKKKGLLQPKEAHAIPIRIFAFDQPCLLNLTMICKLLDHTQHIKHKESVAEYYHRDQELAGQFTITEKGTTYPKNEVVILPKPETFFTTLSISVCVISGPDRDLYLSVEDQLEQSPQKRLRLDLGVVFINYCSALVESVEKEEYFRNLLDMQKIDLKDKQNYLEKFKNVIECIIADTMLCNVFGEYVRFSNNLYQPYYSQCTIHGEMYEPFVGKEVLKKKHKLELKRHMHMTKSYLNAPQPTIIDDVFKELIRDSVHSVFQLGDRGKCEKLPFEYAHGVVKHKFRCPMPQKRVLKTNRMLIDEANMKQAIIKVFNGTYSERRAAIIYEIRRTTLQCRIKRILSKYTKESYLTHNGERADDLGNDSIDEDSPK
ncbi:hypothetical protein RN001_012446 [Aquatica leii]|uniref:Uncharacterized protein n=1 Tax=Aquatica leii TaxID=1421715 RepID=A0AAN7P329_9COLE|nr:hypothetical protein RN001_012446 [Aquatica leii]